MENQIPAPPLLALKQKYKKVHIVPIMDIEVCFKLPTWGEYKNYIWFLRSGLIDKVSLYEYIFKTNVLDEELVDKMYSMPAGLVDSIVELILRLAGNPLMTQEDIDKINNDINLTRNAVQSNIYEQFITIICRAFPSYKPDDLDNLDWQELLRLLLLAEAKLKSGYSQIIATGENQFTLVQWPEEANVNITPKQEEPKKKKNLFDQIKEDAKQMSKDNPDMIRKPPPQTSQRPKSKRDIEMMKMNEMRRRGEIPPGGRAR